MILCKWNGKYLSKRVIITKASRNPENENSRLDVDNHDLLSRLHDALLLREHDLDVRRRGGVALHPSVSLVDPPVPERLGPVALDVGDDELLTLHVRADSGERVLDQLDEEFARLLRPAGGRAAPLLPLRVVGDALVVAEERDGALVSDNGLEIFERLVSRHALDRAADFEHRLEVNALLDGLRLEARRARVESVGLAHCERTAKTALTA